MKRIIPATIILLIIFLGYIGSYIYVNNICNTVNQKIENCIKEYEEIGNAKNDAFKLKKYWDKKEKILSFFVNHNMIDEVEMTISKINLYSEFENNYIFYDSCNTAQTLLHQIIEDTKISAHSVF